MWDMRRVLFFEVVVVGWGVVVVGCGVGVVVMIDVVDVLK